MIRTLLGHLFNAMWSTPALPPTVQRHRGHRQAGYVMAGMAVVGAYEGYKANQNANNATGAESQSAATQTQLANRDARVSNQFLSLYDQKGLPALDRYMKESEIGVNPETAAHQAAGAIDQQAAAGNRAMLRTDADYGINPNSGAAMSSRANANLNTAVAKAGAATAARQQAISTTLARLQGGAAAGENLLGASESFTGNSIQGFSSAGNLEGQVGNAYANEAEGYGQLAGYGASQAFYKPPVYMYPTTQPPVPATSGPPSGPPNN